MVALLRVELFVLICNILFSILDWCGLLDETLNLFPLFLNLILEFRELYCLYSSVTIENMMD